MSPLELDKLLEVPRLSFYLDKVDKAIQKSLVSSNRHINEPLTRLISISGKKIRSSLLIAIAYTYTKRVDQKVIDACVAIELIHLGSLIHDDIIDNAASRRGITTINQKEGSSIAIIIGDYVFGKAFLESSKINQKVTSLIGDVITQLCDGQITELVDKHNLIRSEEAYLKSIQGKTAALLSITCQIAASCIDLNEDQTKALTEFGYNFGMSFQLMDDLLDLLSSDELLGKATGTDIKEGVYNLPLIYSLRASDSSTLKSKISQYNTRNRLEINEILYHDKSFLRTIDKIKFYNEKAKRPVADLVDRKLDIIIKLPDFFIDWSIDNLVGTENKHIFRQ